MPTFKDITITMFTPDGYLPEYGGRKNIRQSQVSCFVPSTANLKFGIEFAPLRQLQNSMKTQLRDAKYSDEQYTKEHWDLCAHIHIDGRRRPDKRMIIKVPSDNESLCTNRAFSRIVQTDDGAVEQYWVFREIGIDSFIEKLSLDADETATKPGDQRLGAAEIKVELFRTIRKGTCSNLRPQSLASRDQTTAEARDIDLSLVHNAGYTQAKKTDLPVYVDVHYLDYCFRPWATFIFLYRGEQQLKKMGLVKDAGGITGLMNCLSNVSIEQQCERGKKAPLNKRPNDEELNRPADGTTFAKHKIRRKGPIDQSEHTNLPQSNLCTPSVSKPDTRNATDYAAKWGSASI